MAGGIITTGNIPKELWPGVHNFFGLSYGEHPEEFRDLFTVLPSTKNYEEDVLVTGFGLATIKDQTGSVNYTSHGQKWVKRYTNVTYGLGFMVSREEIEDNQYKELAMKRAAALAFSMRTTKEIVHANIINRKSSTSYVGGDSSALEVADHATESGSQSNLLSPAADLSEAAIEDVGIMVMTAKNDKGLQIPLLMLSIHIPANEWYEANRIIKSELQSYTSNNAVNVLKMTNAFPEGIKMNHYFTDTDAWGVKTNCPNGFQSFERRAREFTQDNDFDTENAKHKSTERYIAGWTDFRCWYGCPGA